MPILHTVQYCSSQSGSRLTAATPNLQDLAWHERRGSSEGAVRAHAPFLCGAAVCDAGGSVIPRSVRRVERQRTRNRSRFVLFAYNGHPWPLYGGNPRTPCSCAQRERLVHWSYAYAYDAGCSEGATPPPNLCTQCATMNVLGWYH